MILHRKYIIYWLCDTHWNWDADCSAWRTSQWLSGSARSCEAARLRSIPCDRNASVAQGIIPLRGAGLGWCAWVWVSVRVREPGRRILWLLSSLPAFERTVGVGAQLSSYMISQCSWMLSKKKKAPSLESGTIRFLYYWMLLDWNVLR